MLPSLPGVLIAGLALIFAIRERGCAKEFKSKFEEESRICRTATKEAARYRAILDHSNIGLWQVDVKGITLYANSACVKLMGVDNIEEIKDIPDQQFLLTDNSNKHTTQPYRALLLDKSGNKRDVLVSEQSVVHDATAMSIKVRTVVDCEP